MRPQNVAERHFPHPSADMGCTQASFSHFLHFWPTLLSSSSATSMFQDEQRNMAKQPVAHIPTQQPDATAGLTANRAEIIPLQPATPQHNHPAPQPPPPPCNQSQTFCPTENIPGAPDGNKAYGTFKNNPPVVPATMTANSAFGKEPPAASCGVGAQYAEQNNTATTWTNLSQTTVVLGIDGNMSVQTGSLTRVSPRKRHVGLHAACRLPVEFAWFFLFLMRYGRLLRTCGDVLRINQTERMLCIEIATRFGQKMIGCMRAGKNASSLLQRPMDILFIWVFWSMWKVWKDTVFGGCRRHFSNTGQRFLRSKTLLCMCQVTRGIVDLAIFRFFFFSMRGCNEIAD